MSVLATLSVGEIFRYLYYIYMIVAVLTAVSVVLNNRVPVKTIAWVMVILAIPFFGLLIYIIFGRDNRRRKLIGRRFLTQIQKKTLLTHSHSAATLNIPQQYVRIVKFFENVADAYPLSNNDIDIISDGALFLERLLQQIAAAKEHIHVQFYIFADDATGNRVREALMQKAAEGVEVRLLYDDVGCWSVDKAFFEEMRCAGVYVSAFHKVRFPTFASRLNYRNHRKLVVIDGRQAFIGGMNIADRYVTGGKWGKWRDIMLQVQGDAVYGMQTSFLIDWFFADRSMVSGSRYFPRIESGLGALSQVVMSNPVGDWREMLQGMSLVISNCKEYLYIQTPYFMPSEYVLQAIINLALSGVDVRIMIPQRSDSVITEMASRSFIADVMYAGAKVYLYNGGFLHSKMLVCDNMLSSVGSANIDFRSFECNFEINAFLYDADVARRLKTLFFEDMRSCRLYTYKEYRERGVMRRLAESTARLFSPIL